MWLREWQNVCALIQICGMLKCVCVCVGYAELDAAPLPPFPHCPQCLRVHAVISFLLFPSPCLKHSYDSDAAWSINFFLLILVHSVQLLAHTLLARQLSQYVLHGQSNSSPCDFFFIMTNIFWCL